MALLGSISAVSLGFTKKRKMSTMTARIRMPVGIPMAMYWNWFTSTPVAEA